MNKGFADYMEAWEEVGTIPAKVMTLEDYDNAVMATWEMYINTGKADPYMQAVLKREIFKIKLLENNN